jgi:restriction endonuclease S subunit
VSNSVGVAYPAINPSELAALPVWAPPTAEEQEAIVEYLEKEISKIDGLIAKIREAIDRLKEYRTALISAAVTGKIDVRPAMI